MDDFWEILVKPLLTSYGAKYIVEIGSAEGNNTANLLRYVSEQDGNLDIVDPNISYAPSDKFLKYIDFFKYYPKFSHDYLSFDQNLHDAFIIDGDHNWYTVYNELKLIEKNCIDKNVAFPLVLLHDTEWPYGRRDVYYDVENIPLEWLQPYKKLGVLPGENSLAAEGGLNSILAHCVHEGGEKNGVWSAVEDFISESSYRITAISVPFNFGFGLLVDKTTLEKNQNFYQSLQPLFKADEIRELLMFFEKKRIENNLIAQKKYNELFQNLQKLQQRIDEKEDEIFRLRSELSECNKI